MKEAKAFGETIEVADLHPKLREGNRRAAAVAADIKRGFYDQVEAFERGLLGEAYGQFSGNVSQMALALGIDRSHLHAKLKSYGIHSVRARV